MILSTDQVQALEHAQELVKLNKERQRLGEEAWNRLQGKAKKSYEQFGTKLVLVNDTSIARGITGIIATRLLKAFRCPAIVITATEDGRAIGSMRSAAGFNCHDFLSNYADLFDDFGGRPDFRHNQIFDLSGIAGFRNLFIQRHSGQDRQMELLRCLGNV